MDFTHYDLDMIQRQKNESVTCSVRTENFPVPWHLKYCTGMYFYFYLILILIFYFFLTKSIAHQAALDSSLLRVTHC